MNYTAFGPTAELAEHLESEHEALPPALPALGERAAEGEGPAPVPAAGLRPRGIRPRAMRIYTARTAVEGAERRSVGPPQRGDGRVLLKRDFAEAARGFEQVGGLLPDDAPAALMLERCRRFAKQAPPPDWDGAEIGESA